MREGRQGSALPRHRDPVADPKESRNPTLELGLPDEGVFVRVNKQNVNRFWPDF